MRRGACYPRRSEFRLLVAGLAILALSAALLGLYFLVDQPRALVPVLFMAWVGSVGLISVGLTVWVGRR